MTDEPSVETPGSSVDSDMEAGVDSAFLAGEHAPRLYVGIGASAGGLQSLERLFSGMPDDSGLGFVVVQHLSPHHDTMMPELLASRTGLDVRLAQHGTRVRRDTVHLLPPGKHLVIEQGRLLLEPAPQQAVNLPIDRFFASLAADVGTRAVAIVLSGTGTDGSRGVVDVKQQGGLVIAETTVTASFDGMPTSAVNTGAVHQSLAPEEIGEFLVRHARRRDRTGPATGSDADAGLPEEEIVSVLGLLYEQHGIDFTHYKIASVRRRIDRRVALGGFDERADYIRHLRTSPDELDRLYEDMLIGVTRFFRDPQCFELLDSEVLGTVLDRLEPDQPFRAWIAGCATGEEAYSIAMLVHEHLEARRLEIDVKLFATDLHRGALAHAALGIYAADSVRNVPDQRLARHFEPHQNGYRIADHIRQLVLFAPHDVLNDAPFTRLSLVCCRNLLIYFDLPAQQKALRLFDHGLEVGGVLMLGPSETPGPLKSNYEVLDEGCRLFRKERAAETGTGVRAATASIMPTGILRHRDERGRQRQLVPAAAPLEVYDALLDRFMPPGILVDGQDRIVDTFRGAERLLRFPARRPSTSIYSSIDPQSAAPLRASITQARSLRTAQTLELVLSDATGRSYTLDLRLEPLQDGSDRQGGHMLILLRPPSDEGTAVGPDAAGSARYEPPMLWALETDVPPAGGPSTVSSDAVRAELDETRNRLDQMAALADTTAEELQATNEELVASNEELQSSNEELHASNEELHTVNAEYQKKIAELRELNADMQHLLASTDIGTLFLDRELCVRRFTPRVRYAYDLSTSDIGRPIASFVCRLSLADPLDAYRHVLASGETVEREVRNHEGRALLLRITPYEIGEQIAGVVLAMVDIRMLDEARVALASSEASVRRRLAELDSIYATAPAGLALIDTSFRYVRVNERMAMIDGVEVSAYENAALEDVQPASLAARLREIMQRIFDTGEGYYKGRIRTATRAHPDEEREYVVNYYPVVDVDGGVVACSCVVVEMPPSERPEQGQGDDASPSTSSES